MESLFILISFVENENKKKDLFWLVQSHEKAIIDMDIRISGVNGKSTKDFKPWLIVENNTRGLYLLSKISQKFDPWVSFWKQSQIYLHNIPSEIRDVSTWNKKLENKRLKII